jgi:transposase
MKSQCPYDLVIGLDRSDAKADLYYIDVKSDRRWSQTLDTAPERLHDWLADLRQKYPRGRVAVCVEQPAVNLILFLETYSWITLHAINPITLQKYREAFVTSRAKDDGLDARFQAELTLTHWEQLPVWKPQDSQTRRLQQLVLHRRSVVNERTALTNRLQALLKQYYPQALELCGEELWRPLATTFLLLWPSLQAVQKARSSKLKDFYHRQGSRSAPRLEKRLALIQAAVPLTDESALVDTFAVRVQLICRQLDLVRETIATYDAQIHEVFTAHPDRDIFQSLPGAGPVLAPRLLTAMGSDREHYDKAHELQCFSGVAPVTKQSGKKKHVHRRYRCPIFVRQSFHEYAKESVLHCRWAAAYYLQQREERAAPHHTAVRALAFKWQRVIFRCWKDREPYDDARYEATLQRRGSPLVKLFRCVEVGRNPAKKTPPKTQKNR